MNTTIVYCVFAVCATFLVNVAVKAWLVHRKMDREDAEAIRRHAEREAETLWRRHAGKDG